MLYKNKVADVLQVHIVGGAMLKGRIRMIFAYVSFKRYLHVLVYIYTTHDLKSNFEDLAASTFHVNNRHEIAGQS